jgi:hypothetical protein
LWSSATLRAAAYFSRAIVAAGDVSPSRLSSAACINVRACVDVWASFCHHHHHTEFVI